MFSEDVLDTAFELLRLYSLVKTNTDFFKFSTNTSCWRRKITVCLVITFLWLYRLSTTCCPSKLSLVCSGDVTLKLEFRVILHKFLVLSLVQNKDEEPLKVSLTKEIEQTFWIRELMKLKSMHLSNPNAFSFFVFL